MTKEKARENKARFIKKQRALGLCLECNNPNGGKARCSDCLRRRNERTSALRQEAIDSGFCRYCYKAEALEKSKNCLSCLAKQASTYHFKTGKHGHELVEKYEAQKGICAYSGRPLVAGEMELDHIIPLARGGANDVSNVHWVLTSVNRMKRDLPESEFFALIHDIAKHRRLL